MAARLELHPFTSERVLECQAPRVQVQRRGCGIEGLGVADGAVGQIGGIAEHREPQMPEMNPDLVRASVQWPSFEQVGAVGKAPEPLKFQLKQPEFTSV